MSLLYRHAVQFLYVRLRSEGGHSIQNQLHGLLIGLRPRHQLRYPPATGLLQMNSPIAGTLLKFGQVQEYAATPLSVPASK